MNKLFDNKLTEVINKLFDLFLLGILWFIFSLPLITAGASFAAFYDTVHAICFLNRGMLWYEFKTSFTNNFKQTTCIWMLYLFMFIILGINSYMCYRITYFSNTLLIIYQLLFIFFTLWMICAITYTTKFEDTLKTIIINSFLIIFAHLPMHVLNLISLLVLIIVFYYFPQGLFFYPILYMIILNIIMRKIFNNYTKHTIK